MTTKDYDSKLKELSDRVKKMREQLIDIYSDMSTLGEEIETYQDEAWKLMKIAEDDEVNYTDEQYEEAADNFGEWDELFDCVIDWTDVLGTVITNLNQIK